MVLAPLALAVFADLRRRELGVDLIALLAMAGSLALGEDGAAEETLRQRTAQA